MMLREFFTEAWQNLMLHKVRSGLAALGIIFGVASVICMVSISEVARRDVVEQIERLGLTNLIVDSPASLSHDDLREVTRDASSILVPVMPSSIDIHAASRCIADLLLVAKIDRRDRKLAVVANRTRKNTKSLGKLMRFLDSLGIPVIAVLRDSQNFVHAAEEGIGICELTPYKVRKDMEQLDQIIDWLDGWQDRRNQITEDSMIEQSPNVKMFRKPGVSSN